MHQIGATFTRLQPVIEFSEKAFAACTDTVSVLGEPPARFETVHSQSLLNAWYNKVQSCLAEPVQVEQRPGHRRVQVLGTTIFDFAVDGTLQVFAWDFDENDRVMLKELPAGTVVVQEVPPGRQWMDGFKLGALRALCQRHPGQAALCRAYVQWALNEIAKSVWDAKTQDMVRYQIAVAIDLDVWAVGVADQIQLSAQPKLPMRADVYNHAMTYRKDYETLQQEAPQLIPLYALLALKLETFRQDESLELTARMQRLLVANGIKPATWRLLCHDGTQWMKEFLAYYFLDGQSLAEAACDLLRIAQAFGTSKLVAPWLLQAFIQLGGNPNAPQARIACRLDDLFGLCARLGHLVEQADDANVALLQERAHHIFDWAAKYLEKMPAGFASRMTIRSIIRKVDEQQSLDVIRLQSEGAWQAPYSLALTNTECQAVILDSGLAIWTEGHTMRHCATNYIGACAKGDWVMVSLRSAKRGRPLATIAFDVRASRVVMKKIAGFANALVEPQVRRLAEDCRRQIQVQRDEMCGQQVPA